VLLWEEVLIFLVWSLKCETVPVFSEYQPVMEQNLYLAILKGFLSGGKKKMHLFPSYLIIF